MDEIHEQTDPSKEGHQKHPIVKCVRCEGTGWQKEAYGNRSECGRCNGTGIDPINVRR
jgi:DnaJ-class molecular chaperone